MSIDIEAVRKRAEEFRDTKGYTRAGAAHASALDVPALLDEIERLRLVREEWRRLYNQAEAECDQLRAAVNAVRALADEYDGSGLPGVARRIRAALDEHLKEG